MNTVAVFPPRLLSEAGVDADEDGVRQAAV